MSDIIESLGIQIESDSSRAESAIDTLIARLTDLSAELTKYSDGGNYNSAFESIANGLGQIQSVVAGLDVERISAMSNALKRMYTVESGIGEGGGINSLVTELKQLETVNLDNVGQFTALGRAISQLSNASATNVSQNLPIIVEELNKIGTLHIPDTTRLVAFADAIKKLSNATNAVTNIPNIVRELQRLTALRNIPNLAWIERFANGIKQLGSASVQRACRNIPGLASALRTLIRELSEIRLVNRDVTRLIANLAQLSRVSINVNQGTMRATKGLNLFSNASKKASKASSGLAGAIGKVYATYWLLFRAFSKLGEAINISGQLTEVQNVIDATFGDLQYKVDELTTDSIQKFGMSELSVKKFASRFQAMGTAMGVTTAQAKRMQQGLEDMGRAYGNPVESMADMSTNLVRLTADLASFYDVEQSDVAQDLESIFTGMTRPLRTYGLDLTQATLKEWALKNGLDANIESMSQAQKTMLRYQYVIANTTSAHGDFERTTLSWNNQVRQLKQNFQALGAVVGKGLINALKPFVQAMNTALIQVTKFSEQVLNALGKIFGWKITIDVKGVKHDLDEYEESVEDLEGGLGGASKQAKELKNQLMGFDKLNIITTPKDTDKGGSGSKDDAGIDISGQDDIKYAIEKTESLFESEIDTLFKLGEYIGNAINNLLGKIDWANVYEGARDFGKGLADFLNGLISPELFGKVGKTIAGALNTVLYASLSFAENFDFADFGLSIATGINEFFAEYDFKSLAQMLNKWVDGIKTTIITALKNIKWSDVIKGAGDFFTNLELDTIAVIVGALIIKKIGAVTIASTALKSLSKLLGQALATKFGLTIAKDAGIGAVIAEGFKGLIANFGVKGILLGAGSIGAIFAGGGLFFTNIWKAIKEGIDWLKGILATAGASLMGLGVGGLVATFTSVSAAVAGPVGAAIGALVGVVTSGIIAIVQNWNKIKEWWTSSVVPFFTDMPGFMKEKTELAIGFFTSLPGKIGTALGKAVGYIVKWTIDIAKAITTKVPEIIKNVVTWFTELPGKIASAIGGVITALGKWVSDMISFASREIPKFIANVVKFFLELPGKIFNIGKQVITKLVEGMNSVISVAKTAVSDFVKGFINGFKEITGVDLGRILDTLKTKISSAMTSVKNIWNNVWTAMKNTVISIGQPIKNAINTVIKAIETLVNGGLKGVSSLVNNIKKIPVVGNLIPSFNPPTVNLPKLAKGAVIPANQEFMAVLGDQTSGRNLEAPEGLIREIVREESGVGGDDIAKAVSNVGNEQIALLQQQNQLLMQLVQKEFGISANELFNSVRNSADDYFNRTGNPAFAM